MSVKKIMAGVCALQLIYAASTPASAVSPQNQSTFQSAVQSSMQSAMQSSMQSAMQSAMQESEIYVGEFYSEVEESVLSVQDAAPLASTDDITTDTVTISGSTVVSNIKAGQSVAVRGIITSGSTLLTSVAVEICNASTGEVVISRRAYPYAYSYNLKALDDYIRFGTLTAGNYVYRVVASNSINNNYTLVNQPFSVSNGSSTAAADDSLIASNVVEVPTLQQGKTFSIGGVVTSGSSNITTLTAGVYDANGLLVTGRTVYPNAKSYDLKNVDYYVSFGKLAAGSYTYRVTASNASNTGYAVVNQAFQVTASGGTSTPVVDAISITGGVTVPDLQQGKTFSLKGLVNSGSSNISAMTVGVYDANNQLVTGRTVYPNSRSYDIRNVDYYVSFGKLAAGSYTYRVIVSNATNSNYAIVNQPFQVLSSAGGQVTSGDALSITDSVTIPTLQQGKTFSIKGIVKSDTSNITSLTAGVYDANGVMQTGRTVYPNAKSYDLKNVDYYVSFGTLAAGTYTYKVMATNAANSNQVLVNQTFTVTGNTQNIEDNISITDGVTVPTLTEGKTFSIKGIVKSAVTEMSLLTVGVFRMDGTMATGRTVVPSSTSYDINDVDRYVSFGTLQPGDYYYRIIATNGSNTSYTVVNQSFTVEEKGGTSVPLNDTISITNGVTIPTLTEGNVFSVKGTVKSGVSKITSLTAGVYTSDGKTLKTGRTVNPNATSYDIKNLDPYISFGSLPAGTYCYKVLVTNAANSNVAVVNQTFTVKAKTTAAPGAAIKVSGSTLLPYVLVKGTPVTVRGLISSSEVLTSVTVGVYDSKGEFVTGRTVMPNTTSYDLNHLDAYVKFNALPVGSYRYAVYASTASSKDKLVSFQDFRVQL